jgi:hypothetical protein
MPRTGNCLCGKVSFSAEPMPTIQACHCDTCRKWGGGPFMATPCTDAVFEGPVSRFRVSEHGDRGFCPSCGTHLFFFAEKLNLHAIPIGLFDDASGLPFSAEMFVDRKPDYYDFANATKKMTGADYVARFR